MRIRTWTRAGVCVASTALLLAVTTAPAGAAGIATGQTLGVGDSRCTDSVQSDNGARLTGHFTNGTGEWTVLRSSTVGGAETVVFRGPAGSRSGAQPIDRTVAPTAPGAFFYRACVLVNRIMKHSVFSITHYRWRHRSDSCPGPGDHRSDGLCGRLRHHGQGHGVVRTVHRQLRSGRSADGLR